MYQSGPHESLYFFSKLEGIVITIDIPVFFIKSSNSFVINEYAIPVVAPTNYLCNVHEKKTYKRTQNNGPPVW